MKRWSSIIALIMVILLVIGMVATIVTSFTAYAASVSEMQEELDDIIAKRERLEKELQAIKNKKNAAMEEKEIIDEQINDLNKEADILGSVVDDLNSELDQSKEKLSAAEENLDKNTELAKDRIRAMYELGDSSYLSIILKSASIHEFVSRVELAKQMAEYDKKAIDTLKETHETIERETKAIEEKKEKQEQALNSLEKNVANLEDKQSQSNALIEKFNQQSQENIKAIQAAERAEEQLQAEIRKELSEKGDAEFVGGEFLWPVSGYHMITSKFGMRTHPVTGVYKLHTGVDISGSGINGKPVLAANSGKVLKAGYNGGYGNYVVIDHGGGCSTLYGHASRLNVRVGQRVSRGDVIMYVGSSGYSTGPHLHFEVIKNGEYTNPLSYFNINFKFV